MAKPKPEDVWWGIDVRPLLPIGFGVSTVIFGIYMFIFQVPFMVRLWDYSPALLNTSFGVLYTTTLCLMLYTALIDPGQMTDEDVERCQVGFIVFSFFRVLVARQMKHTRQAEKKDKPRNRASKHKSKRKTGKQRRRKNATTTARHGAL